jgi:TrpR family trp operon transcriptional repressor
MKNKYFEQLIDKFLELKTRAEIRAFLQVLLSPKELEEIPVRYEITKLLKQGVSQREIAKKLGVGIATVTRGSKEVKRKRLKSL